MHICLLMPSIHVCSAMPVDGTSARPIQRDNFGVLISLKNTEIFWKRVLIPAAGYGTASGSSQQLNRICLML